MGTAKNVTFVLSTPLPTEIGERGAKMIGISRQCSQPMSNSGGAPPESFEIFAADIIIVVQVFSRLSDKV